MKRGLLAAAMALTTALGFAQSVTFTDVLDTSSDRSGVVYSATYVPGADKYIAGHAGTAGVIEIFNSAGAYESNLNINGITPSDLGFFGLVATDAGGIYAYERGGLDIWRWTSINDGPEKVHDNIPGVMRGGDAVTIGDDIVLALTGSGNAADVHFFSDSFPFASGSFSFNFTQDLESKTHLALNPDATILYTVADTHGPLHKWVFSEANGWTAAPGWPTNIAIGGPAAYDHINDIIFVLDMRSTGRKVVAYNGTTGAVIGEDPVTSIPFATPGYAGSHIEPTANGGTLYMAAKGASNAGSSVVMYEWTYSVDTSSVDDWSLYQQ